MLLLVLFTALIAFANSQTNTLGQYNALYGTSVGSLTTSGGAYAGSAFLASETAIFLQNAQLKRDTVYIVGSGDISNIQNAVELLPTVVHGGLMLTVPQKTNLNKFKYFALIDRKSSQILATLNIDPKQFTIPTRAQIGGIPTLQYGVKSDPIIIINSKQFLIPNFYYNGKGPDAYFWVGSGPNPSSRGTVVPYLGSTKAIKQAFNGQDILLTLPGRMTMQDVGHIGVWCKAYSVNFGHVVVPRGLIVPAAITAA